MRKATPLLLAALVAVALVPSPASAAITRVGVLAGPSTAAMYASGGEYDPVNKRIVVADTGLNRILFYGLNGKKLGGFGTYGDGPTAFNTPRDVAVDGQGRFYVADAANNAVKAYAAAGSHRWTYKPGASLNTPIGLTWDRTSNRLLVASTGNGNVHQLSANGAALDVHKTIQAIRDVMRGPDGHLYVSDYKAHRIRAYDANWNEVVNLPVGDGTFPYNVDWSPDGSKMYVANTGKNVISVWNGSAWSTIGVRCPPGDACDDERLDALRRVSVTPSGQIVAFDFWGGGINVYNASGSLARQIEGATPPDPGFAHASGVDVAKVDGEIRVYAIDRLNQKVEWYRPNGQLVKSSGDRGVSKTAFSWPEAVAVASNGVWVADTRNGRIIRWNLGLTDAVEVVGTTKADSPLKEVADLEVHNGVVYAADRVAKKIVTVQNGVVSDCLTFSQKPEGVALAANGTIHVTFPATGEIVRFPGCGQAASARRDVRAIGVEVRKSDGTVFVTTVDDRVLQLGATLQPVDAFSGKLFDPHTLTVLGRRLWVADTYNHRVLELRVG